MPLRDYPFTVRPLAKEEGGGYLIEFPDLPGCISDGETPEDAIRNGQDALSSYLLTLKDFGKPTPRPGTTSGASGQWRQRVPKEPVFAIDCARQSRGGQPEHPCHRDDRRRSRQARKPHALGAAAISQFPPKKSRIIGFSHPARF
jgi:predicted RNase H-like HicB family nuclease